MHGPLHLNQSRKIHYKNRPTRFKDILVNF